MRRLATILVLLFLISLAQAQAQLHLIHNAGGETLTLGVENSAVPDGVCRISNTGAPVTVAQDNHQRPLGPLVVVQDNPHTGLILYRLDSTEVTAAQQITKPIKQTNISLETEGDIDLALGLNERDEVVITTKQDGHDYPALYAGKPLILIWTVKEKQSPRRVKAEELSSLAETTETKDKEKNKTAKTNGQKRRP